MFSHMYFVFFCAFKEIKFLPAKIKLLVCVVHVLLFLKRNLLKTPVKKISHVLEFQKIQFNCEGESKIV